MTLASRVYSQNRALMKSAPDRLNHTLSLSVNCVPARLLSGGINLFDHYWIGYEDRTINPSEISPLDGFRGQYHCCPVNFQINAI